VRRIRFWRIKSSEQDCKLLYWTISKILFWNLFTSQWTSIIHWVEWLHYTRYTTPVTLHPLHYTRYTTCNTLHPSYVMQALCLYISLHYTPIYTKSAIHPVKRSHRCTQKIPPYIHSKESYCASDMCIHSCIHSKEPYIKWKRVLYVLKESYMYSKEPYIHSKGHESCHRKCHTLTCKIHVWHEALTHVTWLVHTARPNQSCMFPYR